ncbi:hypothetical protein BKA81DRAFT_227552 [Phyllosticta paracitricarpa]|uniref:Uncharacterized protein n=1 Tax=Phyllosticta paracitricarpa TaxID=2016321 RepID=A0ABR1MS15_9PEZI
MFDLNVFAVLTPYDKSQAAIQASRLRVNNHFRLWPKRETLPGANRDFSRDSTANPTSEDDDDVQKYEDGLLLKFNDLPNLKYAKEGWRFGTSSRLNDVALQATGRDIDHAVKKVSRHHFSIMIDDNLRVFLHDSSSGGMSVGFDGQNDTRKKNHFTWLLSLPPGENIWDEVVINVPDKGGFRFQIQFPHHKTRNPTYIARLKEFVRMSKTQPPSIEVLGLGPEPEKPTPAMSMPVSGGKGRMKYTAKGILGRGGFGIVRKIVDLEDGQVFAVKELIKNTSSRMDMFKNGVRMMMDNEHPNILRVVDFDEGPTASLTLEYCPLGSLQANPPRSTDLDSIVSILRQTLMGLSYMHGRNYAHRDLKPDNILIKRASPLTIAISDFGLAKNFTSELTSACGTLPFAAPEIESGSYDGPLVDIWSTGIMMLFFLNKIENIRQPSKFETIPGFAKRLGPMVAGFEKSNSALERLLASMLRLNPLHRLNANQCLHFGHVECLFQLSGGQCENGPAYGGPKETILAPQPADWYDNSGKTCSEFPKLSSNALRHIADHSFNSRGDQGTVTASRNIADQLSNPGSVQGTSTAARHPVDRSFKSERVQSASITPKHPANQIPNMSINNESGHITEEDPFKAFIRTSQFDVSTGRAPFSHEKTTRPQASQAPLDTAFFQVHTGNPQAPQGSSERPANLKYNTATQKFLKDLSNQQTPQVMTNDQKNSQKPNNFVDPKLLAVEKGKGAGNALQAPPQRTERSRSRSPGPANNKNDKTESRISKPSNSTARVTRSAAALERAAQQYQPYPVPSARGSQAHLVQGSKSRDTPEKSSGGISRLWGRK